MSTNSELIASQLMLALEIKKVWGSIIVIPDWFVGSDFQKVQQAMDYALKYNSAIVMTREYDITGMGTLKLKKTTSLDRKPLIFIGQGGSIRKNDAGYIFSSDTTDVGDMFFNNLIFNSVAGAGVKIFDCNKLIRITSRDCVYRNVDTIAYVDDTRMYMQSMRFMGDSVVGGSGFGWDFVGAYDCSWDNVLVEARTSGIRQRFSSVAGSRYLYNCRIRDSAIEGLSGTAISLANTESLVIDGCYFEKNIGGDIVFNASSVQLNVTVSNCRKYGGGAETNALIKWGQQAKNCTSDSNMAYDTAVHNTTQLQTSHFILSRNDRSLNDTANIIGSFDPVVFQTTNSSNVFKTQANGDKVTYLGVFKRLYKESSANISLTANEKRQIQVQFSETIPIDASISVQCFVSSNKFISVCYVGRDGSDNKIVNVFLQNLETTATNVQFVAVTVMKPFFSTTG